MDKQQLLANFIKSEDSRRAQRCFEYLKDYLATLEQKNSDLQAIVADPEGEIARCRAEVRELQLKLRLQDAYSISSEERKVGHTWLTKHAEQHHGGECGYHWEILPFSLGIAVDIICDDCGEKYHVRAD